MKPDVRSLKVLVVDDSPQIRKAVSAIVTKELAPVEVATAANGRLALEKLTAREFDLILLDLSMPLMDGFTFLRLFRARSQTPVLVVSALVDMIYVERALEMGANAFLGKPGDMSRNEDAIREEFRLKLNKLLPLEVLLERRQFARKAPVAEKNPAPVEMTGDQDFPVVAIGCSSGGPATLQYLLSGIPKNIGGAILIAQHMPKGFTSSMVERMGRLTGVPVIEAQENTAIVPGTIYFCPGGINMAVECREGGAFLSVRPVKERDIAPNVDILFESAAEVFGKRLTGIILTGMGKDGSEGVKRIKATGGVVIAESDETAAIYGMPREAAATGCVDDVLALPDISVKLIRKMMPLIG